MNNVDSGNGFWHYLGMDRVYISGHMKIVVRNTTNTVFQLQPLLYQFRITYVLF